MAAESRVRRLSKCLRTLNLETIVRSNWQGQQRSPRVNFAEYFAVVGLGPVELQQQVKDTKIGSNLNDLKQPADTNQQVSRLDVTEATVSVRLLWQYSREHFEKVFKAHIIDRYPYESGNEEVNESKQTPFPSGLPLFCFPDGYKYVRDNGVPSLHFCVPGAGGGHVYGHCLTIYDLISPAVCGLALC